MNDQPLIGFIQAASEQTQDIGLDTVKFLFLVGMEPKFEPLAQIT